MEWKRFQPGAYFFCKATDGSGVVFDVLDEDCGSHLRLRTGATATRDAVPFREALHGPAALPGEPLLTAVLHRMDRTTREWLNGRAGSVLWPEDLARLFAPVLDAVRRGEAVLAGLNGTAGPGAGYVAVNPGALGLYRFDVDGTATPVFGPLPTLHAVRVFTPEEWHRIAAQGGWLTAPGVPPRPAAGQHIITTGTAGRPTSMHLIRPEHMRRLAAGEAHTSVSAEASHLAEWFKSVHPDAPQPTAKTIENAIRAAHRRHHRPPPK